jgi:hypothetical protein
MHGPINIKFYKFPYITFSIIFFKIGTECVYCALLLNVNIIGANFHLSRVKLKVSTTLYRVDTNYEGYSHLTITPVFCQIIYLQ